MSNFFIDEFVWSFSRINAYKTCPYMFKLTYINEEPKVNNAFAQFGTLCHDILERYANGELLIFELSSEFEKRFDEIVTERFPPNKYKDLRTSYFEQGLNYFDGFQGFEDYEVIEAEKEVNFKIDNYKINGYIDLLLRDKDGCLQITDHKSKSSFKNKAEKDEYLKQLYLYSIPVYEEFKEYPKRLNFNMFRTNEWEYADFKLEELENAKLWVRNTIESIYYDKKFKPNQNSFFCNFLCSVRDCCEFKA